MITGDMFEPVVERSSGRVRAFSPFSREQAVDYQLTAAGKAQLSREQNRSSKLVHAIGRIMNPAPDSE